MSLQKIKLTQSEHFKNRANIDKLNRLVEIHTTLSPTLLMDVTNCTFDDALYVLMVLYELYIVDGFILVYYMKDQGSAIQRRSFSSGFPQLPLRYAYEGRTIIIKRENLLFFKFEFDRDPTKAIIFET